MPTGTYCDRSFDIQLSGVYPIALHQRRQPGVYALSGLNRPIGQGFNFSLYIGSSLDPIMRSRGHRHQLRTDQHSNDVLQNVWNKDGESNVTFVMLEACSREVLRSREQQWIDFYCSAYGENSLANVITEVDSVEHLHTPEMRRRLAEVGTARWTGEGNPGFGTHRVGSANPFYGRRHSATTRAKLSVAARKRVGAANPFAGKHHTAEVRALISRLATGRKMSESQRAALSVLRKGRPNPSVRRPVAQIDPTTHQIVKRYASGAQAAIETGIDGTSISRVCRGKSLKGHVCRSAGGFVWRFINPDGTLIQPPTS